VVGVLLAWFVVPWITALLHRPSAAANA
jgi:hypothetical protein